MSRARQRKIRIYGVPKGEPDLRQLAKALVRLSRAQKPGNTPPDKKQP
jgi:hypothetical protein